LQSLRTTALAASVVFLSITSTHAASLNYQFNDPTPLVASGSLGAGGRAVALTSPAVIGAAGSGVSGAAADRALNLTAATGMGGTTNGTGGRAAEAADADDIDGLLKFTVSGWFKTDGATPIGNNAVLAYNRSGVAGFAVYGSPTTPGSLTLAVDNGTVDSAGFGATGQWVNFAVTYDGTGLQPGPNVFFYAGSKTSPLALVGSGTNTNGTGNDPADNDSAALSFGARNLFGSLNGDSFDGFLDNFRISDGIVSLSQLEALRAADAGVVAPEPATLAALGLLGLGLVRRRANRA
jgi:hypothetical protein